MSTSDRTAAANSWNAVSIVRRPGDNSATAAEPAGPRRRGQLDPHPPDLQRGLGVPHDRLAHPARRGRHGRAVRPDRVQADRPVVADDRVGPAGDQAGEEQVRADVAVGHDAVAGTEPVEDIGQELALVVVGVGVGQDAGQQAGGVFAEDEGLAGHRGGDGAGDGRPAVGRGELVPVEGEQAESGDRLGGKPVGEDRAEAVGHGVEPVVVA